jgi:hypothetical protein
MGLFSRNDRTNGSSNGRSRRNSSAHGHPPITEKRAKQARVEKWDAVAWQKKQEFGEDSAEYRQAKAALDKAVRALRSI